MMDASGKDYVEETQMSEGGNFYHGQKGDDPLVPTNGKWGLLSPEVALEMRDTQLWLKQEDERAQCLMKVFQENLIEGVTNDLGYDENTIRKVQLLIVNRLAKDLRSGEFGVTGAGSIVWNLQSVKEVFTCESRSPDRDATARKFWHVVAAAFARTIVKARSLAFKYARGRVLVISNIGAEPIVVGIVSLTDRGTSDRYSVPYHNRQISLKNGLDDYIDACVAYIGGAKALHSFPEFTQNVGIERRGLRSDARKGSGGFPGPESFRSSPNGDVPAENDENQSMDGSGASPERSMTSERPHETLFDIFDKEKKEQNGNGDAVTEEEAATALAGAHVPGQPSEIDKTVPVGLRKNDPLLHSTPSRFSNETQSNPLQFGDRRRRRDEYGEQRYTGGADAPYVDDRVLPEAVPPSGDVRFDMFGRFVTSNAAAHGRLPSNIHPEDYLRAEPCTEVQRRLALSSTMFADMNHEVQLLLAWKCEELLALPNYHALDSDGRKHIARTLVKQISTAVPRMQSDEEMSALYKSMVFHVHQVLRLMGSDSRKQHSTGHSQSTRFPQTPKVPNLALVQHQTIQPAKGKGETTPVVYNKHNEKYREERQDPQYSGHPVSVPPQPPAGTIAKGKGRKSVGFDVGQPSPQRLGNRRPDEQVPPSGSIPSTQRPLPTSNSSPGSRGWLDPKQTGAQGSLPMSNLSPGSQGWIDQKQAELESRMTHLQEQHERQMQDIEARWQSSCEQAEARHTTLLAQHDDTVRRLQVERATGNQYGLRNQELRLELEREKAKARSTQPPGYNRPPPSNRGRPEMEPPVTEAKWADVSRPLPPPVDDLYDDPPIVPRLINPTARNSTTVWASRAPDHPENLGLSPVRPGTSYQVVHPSARTEPPNLAEEVKALIADIKNNDQEEVESEDVKETKHNAERTLNDIRYVMNTGRKRTELEDLLRTLPNFSGEPTSIPWESWRESFCAYDDIYKMNDQEKRIWIGKKVTGNAKEIISKAVVDAADTREELTAEKVLAYLDDEYFNPSVRKDLDDLIHAAKFGRTRTTLYGFSQYVWKLCRRRHTGRLTEAIRDFWRVIEREIRNRHDWKLYYIAHKGKNPTVLLKELRDLGEKEDVITEPGLRSVKVMRVDGTPEYSQSFGPTQSGESYGYIDNYDRTPAVALSVQEQDQLECVYDVWNYHSDLGDADLLSPAEVLQSVLSRNQHNPLPQHGPGSSEYNRWFTEAKRTITSLLDVQIPDLKRQNQLPFLDGIPSSKILQFVNWWSRMAHMLLGCLTNMARRLFGLENEARPGGFTRRAISPPRQKTSPPAIRGRSGPPSPRKRVSYSDGTRPGFPKASEPTKVPPGSSSAGTKPRKAGKQPQALCVSCNQYYIPHGNPCARGIEHLCGKCFLDEDSRALYYNEEDSYSDTPYDCSYCVYGWTTKAEISAFVRTQVNRKNS